jgi:hypothetical protein
MEGIVVARARKGRRSTLLVTGGFVLLLAVFVPVYLVLANRGTDTNTRPTVRYGVTTESTTPVSSSSLSPTSTSIATSGQKVLARAVVWIEAAPTKVTFGPYAVIYGRAAKVAELTVATHTEGEPMFSGTWWWSADTDYYFQEAEGPPEHVTPEMAISMRQAAYPDGEIGVMYLVMLRFALDPHRLLALSQVTAAAEDQDGTWRIEAEATTSDLVGANLSDAELGRYSPPIPLLRTTLEIGRDGNIHSMSMVDPTTPGWAGWTYAWSRVSEGPTLPASWVDMDKATLQDARDSGWRASPADAAKDASFPVYWLGESYEGLPLRGVRVNRLNKDLYVLLEYNVIRSAPDASGKATSTSLPAEGYVLFQYSESNVPGSEKRFVENKTLIKTAGQGEDAYSVYKTAKGAPGRSILVKRGETYISIDRTGGGTGDVTEGLLGAAAALRRAEP